MTKELISQLVRLAKMVNEMPSKDDLYFDAHTANMRAVAKHSVAKIDDQSCIQNTVSDVAERCDCRSAYLDSILWHAEALAENLGRGYMFIAYIDAIVRVTKRLQLDEERPYRDEDITDQTQTPLLKKACEKMAGFLEEWKDSLAGVQMTHEDFDENSGLADALTVLTALENASRQTVLASRTDTQSSEWAHDLTHKLGAWIREKYSICVSELDAREMIPLILASFHESKEVSTIRAQLKVLCAEMDLLRLKSNEARNQALSISQRCVDEAGTIVDNLDQLSNGSGNHE